MKKSYLVLGVIALIVIFFGIVFSLFAWFAFNGLSKADEGINQQWQQVEVAYQARMDKTKNLLKIVEGAAEFEKGTLKEIVEARSNATSIKLSVDELTPENLAKFQKAQDALGQSLGRLMAISENYPSLKAVDAYRDFQAQYEGMENRISTERKRFNDVVGSYNASIRTFPRNLLAGMFGFEKRAYFESAEGTENAPDIGEMMKK
jgi:LemA protein